MRLARAPGRVNLIGEHTDYNGLPVLPMALDREIALRYLPRSDRRVILHNTDPRFPTVTFPLGAEIAPGPAGDWGNYPRAAAQALWREGGPLRGLEGTVSSTLPAAAGLSSSSALVVATALALLDVAGRAVPPTRLMALLARGEQYVGLQGGGMDQAVSLGGRAGHALRIDFHPALSLRPVPIPDDWRFVVASSLVEASKAAGAREAYNARVAECREALARVAEAGLGVAPPGDIAALLARTPAVDALAAAAGVLDERHFRRFRHVVTEARRVDQAEGALRAGDLEGFGRLMRASHASLRDDYDVSTPALDELVARAESAGAAGARLTGAGFGGCIVALVPADRADAMAAALADGFYRPRGRDALAEALVFVARPGPGADVLIL